MLATAAVAFVALAHSGCATSFFGFGRAAADVLLPVSEENKLGAQLVREVEKKQKLHPSHELQSYVASVGARIAKKAARETPRGIKFTYKVIDDDKTVNAFALPGGHIYVYSGLLKLADNEAELAAVLAHETAHVTQRHVAQRMVAQYGIETVLGLALGKDPGLIEQIGAQLLEGGTLLRFTHSEEADADAHGLPYAVAAGYNPNGMVSFFQKLLKESGKQPRFMTYLSDHPLPAERVAATRARINKMRHPPHNEYADRYRDMKKLI